MTILTKAILFATKKHDQQTDKMGEPYILHPLRVMLDCNSMIEKVVAILHDVVEDTNATLDDIYNLFKFQGNMADTVVNAVDALTKRKNELYEDYLNRVKSNSIALTVKFADIRDNMSPIRQIALDKETQTRLKRKYIKAITLLQ